MQRHIDALAIIELDTNDDVSLVWVFPSLDKDAKQVVLKCSRLGTEKNADGFSYTAFDSKWLYMYTSGNGPSSALPKVKKYTLCISTGTFNPEKYEHLIQALARLYATTGEPTSILQGVLRANTTGKFPVKDFKDSQLKDWDVAAYEDKKALLAGTSLSKVVSFFGEQFILLWIGVVLKKRIFVLADQWSDVNFVVRALPQLAWLRLDWSLCRPMVLLDSKEQLAELEKLGVYIAGTLDTAIRGRHQLYDILVDMKSQKIVVAEGAKGSVVPPRNLADFARQTVKLAGDKGSSDHALIKHIAKKTGGLLSALKKIADGKKLTLSAIEAQGSDAVGGRVGASFLYNLAQAEGLS